MTRHLHDPREPMGIGQGCVWGLLWGLLAWAVIVFVGFTLFGWFGP